MISVTAALFAMPLVAARFHIVSPVGILINVVLCPLATVVLWLGYLHLGIGLVIPWASHVVGIPFDLGLSTLIGLVQLAARVKLSHVYVAGPPAWWLAGYYSLLFALVFMPSVRRTGCRGWSTLAAWTIVGLAWGLRSPAPQGLRCTFLSVGHGEAILLEGPAGGTLLYDAGAIEDGRVAQRAVQSTLWERRRTQIDALVASHADIDHFNGMTGLMQSLPVGELLVSQQFLDFRQPAVVALCNASDACHVPIKLVRDGDRLRLDDGVELTVLHPRPGRPQADDNANSIVLSIEFAGRRILLTGDLEGSGQASLLSQPPRPTDILLAPHHGSRKANSAALARWARPRQVIVSGGPRTDFHSLRSAYGPQAEILSTDDYGAITFDIHPDGTIERTTVRHPEVHR